MDSFLDRLKRRKLFQWAIAYAGGAWLVLQLLSLLAQPFAWPDLVIRAAVVVLSVGFAAVLVLAWFHGEKGAQRAGGIELLMLGALFIVAAAGVALVARGRSENSGQPAARAPADSVEARSIAVLPFDNMSDVAGNEYFSDGITEDILTNLAKVRSLRVISRTSAMKYKNTDKPVPEIARELGVAHILEGSVRRVGNQVRITAQLIRARDDAHLWAQNYDRDITNIFAVQTEIATEIAQALNAQLSEAEGQRLATRPTESVEAYDLYLRARTRYLTVSTADAREAQPLLRNALELDPGFAGATALLSRTYSSLSQSNFAWGDSAISIGQRAVQQGPSLAETHSALGEAYRALGRYEEALVEIKRALEIDPNYSWAVGEMGETLGPYGMGRIAEALPWAERAARLDPAVGWIYVLTGDAWRQLGDLSKARAAFEAGMRADPNYLTNAFSRFRLTLQQGDTAHARQQIAQIIEFRPTYQPAAFAIFYAEAGFAEEAARLARLTTDSALKSLSPGGRALHLWYRGERARALRELPAWERDHADRIRAGSRSPAPHINLAAAAMMRDRPQEALDQLEQYFAKGGRDEALLRQHILFAPLQKEPRMQAVLKRIRDDIAAQRARLVR